MLNCLVLYRGERLADLQLVTLSADRELVSDFVQRVLAKEDHPEDAALAERHAGVRKALEHIACEVAQ